VTCGQSYCVTGTLVNDWFEPAKRNKPAELTIVWNHRWEYDKALEIFFQALRLLLERNIPFRVHLLGQAFRSTPALFYEMRAILRNQLGQWQGRKSRGVSPIASTGSCGRFYRAT
jgi:hypothetical protein